MVKDESLESIKHAIRKAGLRATPTRIAILQMLLHSKSPQTHSVVAESLSDLGTDCATVLLSAIRARRANGSGKEAHAAGPSSSSSSVSKHACSES
jgi:hypothetical protein